MHGNIIYYQIDQHYQYNSLFKLFARNRLKSFVSIVVSIFIKVFNIYPNFLIHWFEENKIPKLNKNLISKYPIYYFIMWVYLFENKCESLLLASIKFRTISVSFRNYWLFFRNLVLSMENFNFHVSLVELFTNGLLK